MTAISSSKSGSETEKSKKEKYTAPTRVVIRRLPPTMTKDEFEEQISPIPDHDNLRFSKADFSLDQDAFCTAYINFLNQDDVYIFQERFDGYVFVDNKGAEYVAMVEFAPNQKIAVAKENKKRDPKINTIDQDPDFIKFLEMLENAPEGTGNTVEQTLEEIERKEKEMSDKKMTPLLLFMKEKGEEKKKKREEQREQRRKKEEERKKAREEERLKRKENKEKEIKDREKRDKEKKKNEKTEDDVKGKNSEKKTDGKEGESNDSKEPSEKKTRKEIEKEKRQQREEREKERFRKREEERRKRKEEEKEKKKSKDVVIKDKEEIDRSRSETKSSKQSANVDNPVETSNEDPKDESKTKKYSDKRKEDRLKREKEKADKKRKEDGIITIEDDSSRDGSRDDILEGLSKPSEIITVNDTSDSAESEVKKEKKKSYREKREEKRQQRPDQGDDSTAKKEKRESEREKRDRKFKKPDMQIYRPGMGRFSSKTVKKEDEEKSPKTSPDESRDSSPNKKVTSKSSRNPSPDDKKTKFKNTFKPVHDEEKVKDSSNNKKKFAPENLPSALEEAKVEEPAHEASSTTQVTKGKSYRANRAAKQKKPDSDSKKTGESNIEKAEQDLEKPANAAASAERSHKEENNTKPSFDDDKIPPLTASKHVIILDNDQ